MADILPFPSQPPILEKIRRWTPAKILDWIGRLAERDDAARLEKLIALCGIDDERFEAWAERHRCPSCKGAGERVEMVRPPPKIVRCEACNGLGSVEDDYSRCRACHGSGEIERACKPIEKRIDCLHCCRGLFAKGIDPDAVFKLRDFYLPFECEIEARWALSYDRAEDDYQEPPLAPKPSGVGTTAKKARVMAIRTGATGYVCHPRHHSDVLNKYRSPLKERERLQRPVQNRRNGTPVAGRIQVKKGVA